MPNLSTGCILGTDFMRLFNVVLHSRECKISAEGLSEDSPIELSCAKIEEEDSKGLGKPTDEQMEQLKSLLNRLLPADPDLLGCTNIAEHVIDVGDA